MSKKLRPTSPSQPRSETNRPTIAAVKARKKVGDQEPVSSSLDMQSLNQELRIMGSELRSRNDHLNRTRDELRNLFENTVVPLVFTDLDLNVRQFTSKLSRLINLIPADVGHPLGRLFINLKKEELLRNAAEVLKTRTPKEVEAEDNEGRFFLIRIAPYMGIEGKVGGVVISFTDVHEARMQKSRALENEKRYQMLFESIDEGFCILERTEGKAGGPVDFRYVEVNPAFTAQSGISGVVGKTVRQVLQGAPHDFDFLLTYESILKTGQPSRFERVNGVLQRVFDVYAFRVNDGSNRRLAVIFNDITERKRAEQSSALLGAIVNSSADAIYSKDLNGIITSWNHGAERLLQYGAQEAIGQPVTFIIPKDRQKEAEEILERIRLGERVDHFETIRVSKDGSLLNLSITISPVNDISGRIMGASIIAREIVGASARTPG